MPTKKDGSKEQLTKYLLDGLPEGLVPVFIKFGDKCYPQKAVSDMVLECMEELFTRIITTSKTPQAMMQRIALLKQHPNTRTTIWTEAFKRVIKRIEPRTEAQVQQEFKEKCEVVNLEELA